MAGRVGIAQVRVLAWLAANRRVVDRLPDSEDVLLEAAQSLEFGDFRVVTARWEQLADADGASQAHERAHAERNARCDFDGAVFRFETAHGVIQAIDPVCGWLGCNLRVQIAAIDHLQPRSRGGPTDARNAKIMCDHHNIFKHTAGYQVERLDDGTIAITRPDGTPLRPPDAA